MKQSKKMKRKLAIRQKDFDNMTGGGKKDYKGYRRPGSNSK